MLYSQLGYYISSKISQWAIKEEMKERILKDVPDSLLTAVVLNGNENNIDWEEEGKEFSFKGAMYDVVRSRMVEGKTVLYCSNDEKEDQLLDQQNDITKSNTQNTGKNSKVPEIKLIYDCVVAEHPGYFISSLPNVRAFMHYDAALLQQATANITPPPRV